MLMLFEVSSPQTKCFVVFGDTCVKLLYKKNNHPKHSVNSLKHERNFIISANSRGGGHRHC